MTGSRVFERFWTQQDHVLHTPYRFTWGEPYVFTYEELREKHNILILLGEPNMGKSTESKYIQDLEAHAIRIDLAYSGRDLRQQLREDPVYQGFLAHHSSKSVQETSLDTADVSSVFSSESTANLKGVKKQGTQTLTLLIDSLDEVTLADAKDAILSLFTELNKLPNKQKEFLRLRFFCRVADWSGRLKSLLTQRLFSLQKNANDSELPPEKWIAQRSFHLCGIGPQSWKQCFSTDSEFKKFQDFMAERSVGHLLSVPRTFLHILACYQNQNFEAIKSRKAVYQSILDFELKELEEKYELVPEKADITFLEKLEIARHLAVYMLFCGLVKVDVVGKGGTDTSDVVHIDSLSAKHPKAIVKAVVGSGLFIPAQLMDGNHVRWKQKTLLEFCAAWYFHEQNIALKKILQCVIEPSTGKVFQQFRHMTSFLCDFMPQLFDHLLSENYMTLIYTDLPRLTPERKDQLLSRLLSQEDPVDTLDLIRNRRGSFQYLKTENTASILKPYLQAELNERKALLFTYIAVECELYDLADNFETIFIEHSDPESRIQEEIMALWANTPDPQIRAKALKYLESDTRPDQELKGIVLNALWPQNLSAEQLFKALTPITRELNIRSYRGFLGSPFYEQLALEDYPLFFEWLFQSVSKGVINFRWWLQTILQDKHQAIFDFFRNCVNKGEHHSGPSQALLMLLKSKDYIFSYLQVKQRTNTPIAETALKKFIGEVYQAIEQEAQPAQLRKYVRRLTGEGLHLFDETHMDWLAQEIQNADPGSLKYRFFHLLFDLMLDHLYDESVRPILVQINTTNMQAELIEKIDNILHPPPPPPLPVLPDVEPEARELNEVTLQELSEVTQETAENTERWYYLCQLLMCHEHQQFFHRTDVTQNWIWGALPDHLKVEICQRTAQFLNDPSILDALEPLKNYANDRENEINIPGREYYYLKALSIMAHENLKDLILPHTWKKAGPILVFHQSFSPEKIQKQFKELHFVQTALDHAPQEVMCALFEKTKRSLKGDHPYIENRALIEEVTKTEFLAFLEQNTSTLRLSNKAWRVWYRFLIDLKSKTAWNKLVNISKKLNQKKFQERAIYSNALLLEYQSEQAWQIVNQNLKKRSDLITQTLEIAAERLDYPLAIRQDSDLSVKSAYDQYKMLREHFPSNEDRRSKSFGLIEVQDRIYEWKSALLNIIMNSDNAEGLSIASALFEAYPELDWVFAKVRTSVHQKAWKKIDWHDLERQMTETNSRIVNSVGDLMEAVTDSLERFNTRLQGENAIAFALWNYHKVEPKDKQKDKSPKKGQKKTQITWSRKEEKFLSDLMANHLRQDLVNSNLIINREVEISDTREDQPGERCDIIVSSTKDGIKLVVVIEVKGCWNREWEISQENQLVNRYLRRLSREHATEVGGIYAVGWYCTEQKDKKCGCSQKPSQSEKKQRLSEQAQRLNTPLIPVRYIGIDASITTPKYLEEITQ